ncbi:hypothetical protein CPAST_c25400 [Clostridium pasteurianum DSM 525 = ATCC 6013]|uniref:Uncharacterized protein n=1 Tax=Clostridium pasteurianum DSM 525 = ATCC 6013 TaxID=1262449 RepID=A0A0H3J518_CLOPA|nr:hypothetical protein [Clostridium pasteurianum]AJA48609.1 hypothetical protein CPAST_c25400 [Clostridium pasteurianum DSM 525 = ATCC 6013]AJA52597.1 hypothetical protein CLPA_c25400 [Clostridium pasteurianum DSM 525 = ATCC 6013]AOZ75840.1 hypothetical protein AQ983_12340 [Clostridium pasteurianum DSM 525 = ATCC 6013]AOZ79636.1 hypothetical protein AQ984_12335 [Clostridium pasteurianum]ELP57913.1 hypothetical protein F502_16970 [Clostridium pasteurianum DSM 525 = ATCC 6013]
MPRKISNKIRDKNDLIQHKYNNLKEIIILKNQELIYSALINRQFACFIYMVLNKKSPYVLKVFRYSTKVQVFIPIVKNNNRLENKEELDYCLRRIKLGIIE